MRGLTRMRTGWGRRPAGPKPLPALVVAVVVVAAVLLLAAPAAAVDAPSPPPIAPACAEPLTATATDGRLAIVPLPPAAGGEMALVLRQPSPTRLRVDWRFIRPELPGGTLPGSFPEPVIGACVDRTPLPRAGGGGAAAAPLLISLLVDSSRSMGGTLDAPAGFIAGLLHAAAALTPPPRFALTTFAAESTQEVAFGADPAAILAALARIRPSGETTELFRAVRDAVRDVAGRRPGDGSGDGSGDGRAFVLVFSDGRAEDKGYGHADVRRAALADGVAVYAFGHRGSPRGGPGGGKAGGKADGNGGAPPPDLQNLRRLAEDTGGHFYAPTTTPRWPDPLALLQALRSGGSVGFRLPTTTGRAAGPAPTATVTVDARPAGPVAAYALPISISAGRDTPAWQLPALIAGALVAVLLALQVSAWLLMRRMARPAAAAPRQAADRGAVAGGGAGFRVYRVGGGEPPESFATAASIGSGADDQVRVLGAQVPAGAAVVAAGPAGGHCLRPAAATAEVRINGRPTREATPLQDGDLIEIGDSKLHYLAATADALPKPLRRLAVQEDQDAATTRDPRRRSDVEAWWPALALRWPGLARAWQKVAPRLKKRMQAVYRVLSGRLAKIAEGEIDSFFDLNLLVFLVVQVLSLFFDDGSEERPAAPPQPGEPVACLDVLKPLLGRNRRFLMRGSLCRIHRRREPDHRDDRDFVLPDETVSREPRVVIERLESGRFVIRNLGSTNPLLVDNRNVAAEHPLVDRCIIQVGEVPIRFLELA